MSLYESDERKYQIEALVEAEAIIQTVMKHHEMRLEFNRCLRQTRQGGYCVLCGRHFAPDTKRRICLDCKEHLEERHKEVYTELFCYDCGKPYSPTKYSGPRSTLIYE